MSNFSNLEMHLAGSAGLALANSALRLAKYKKVDNQLIFLSHRGYDNIYAYAARRIMMQNTFAALNDLYPKYIRQKDYKRAQVGYNQNQGQELQKIIVNGQRADAESFSQGVSVKYQGKPANEALLLWLPTKGAPQTALFNTYWDKIKELGGATNSAFTEISVAGDPVFLDLGAIVQARSSNNVILTKVQGRDYSRKELISGGDIHFTVTGKITSNYPDVYPYAEVSKFITLMQHKGVIAVSNLLFQQYNVTQILITDHQLSQQQGFKNVQPYSFSCVAVEPDDAVAVVEDTIQGTNLQIASRTGWSSTLLNQVKNAAANQAAQTIESLISNKI